MDVGPWFRPNAPSGLKVSARLKPKSFQLYEDSTATDLAQQQTEQTKTSFQHYEGNTATDLVQQQTEQTKIKRFLTLRRQHSYRLGSAANTADSDYRKLSLENRLKTTEQSVQSQLGLPNIQRTEQTQDCRTERTGMTERTQQTQTTELKERKQQTLRTHKAQGGKGGGGGGG